MKPEEWVYLANLPFQTTEEEIRTLFQNLTEVLNVHMSLDPESKRFMGFAFIHVGSADAAKKAAESLDGQLLGERPMRAMPYDESLKHMSGEGE